MKNSYANHTRSGSVVASNRALISIELCERVVNLLSNAKSSIATNDFASWVINLHNAQYEIKNLISTIDTDKLGVWGEKMRQFYFDATAKICYLMVEEDRKPEIDNLLETFEKALGAWKGAYKAYLEKKEQYSTEEQKEFSEEA